MFRLPMLRTIATMPLFYIDGMPLNLLDIGELDDDAYAELNGFTRTGTFHLREGEELDDRDDGWAGDLEPGIGGGDGAGVGGAFD